MKNKKILILLFLFATQVFASLSITSVTLNNSSSVTVAPNATISAQIFVKISENPKSWKATAWRIGNSGKYTCVNHSNQDENGNADITFNITAPGISGIYDASFIAYSNNKCTRGASGTNTMKNAVIVTTTNKILPIADYHFDECSWNGTAGEVKDSSGNNYNGTAVNGATTESNTTAGGGICHVGEFDGKYIQLSNMINLTSPYSITFWAKFPLNGTSNQAYNAYVIASVDGRGDIGYFVKTNSGYTFNVYDNSGNIRSKKIPNLANGWHFFTLINTGRKTKLYIDNDTSKSYNVKLHTEGNLKIIGSSTDDSSRETIGNDMDEFKVFNNILSNSQIATIYKNEKDKKNYDGTNRVCPICSPLKQCYTDNFNRASLGNLWTIIKKKNYTPQISTNKLVLTTDSGSIATGVVLAGEFPSSNNYIEIEFEHNAYGGSGADGVTVTLADSSVVTPLIETNSTNIAGAYGGSLGYANRTGIDGFKGGWLGFGLDEYGNFSNQTEGRNGGIGFVKNAVAIRGHGSGQTGYEYITGTGTLNPGIDKTPTGGYLYKISIDTRNSTTMIKVERDIRDGNGFKTLIPWYNATQNAPAPAQFKLALTGSTGGSTNIHSIDDLSINAIGCGTIGQVPIVKSSFFDAWDTFRNINDRNISTKIVNKPFNLTIASMDTNNLNLQDFNGTVCTQIVDLNNSGKSLWQKLDFRNTEEQNTTILPSSVSKNVRVKIVWKAGVDEPCPLINEDNSTKTSDNFAIRPLKFSMDFNTTSFYAGVPFHMDVNATKFAGGNSVDYNETNNTSFVFDMNDSNVSCTKGVLGNLPNPFKFYDGNISYDTNYSDVGAVNFSIKEAANCANRFAGVDCKDKNVTGHWNTNTNLSIEDYNTSITVKPYQFAIVDYNFVRNPNQDWRYMSDVNESNITISFKVQAQNKSGLVTKKFDAKCYATDVNVSIDLNSTSNDGNVSYYKLLNNIPIYANDRNLSDFNLTGIINDQNFTDGNSTKVMYALNVYRAFNKPKNPLDINVSDINTTYSLDPNVKNIGLTPDNNGSSFYYGRVKTKDINTNEQNSIHNLELEVYSISDNNYTKGFHQNSLNWYQMQKDNVTAVKGFYPKEGFTMGVNKSGINNITNTQGTSFGVVNFDIINSWSKTDSAYIHIKIPKYLWYSSYKDYNDSNGSDCSTHPCFKYNYFLNENTKNVKSGDFNGTSIGSDYNASKIIKTGVKVFR